MTSAGEEKCDRDAEQLQREQEREMCIECVWGRQSILLSYKLSDGLGCVATGNTQKREGTEYDLAVMVKKTKNTWLLFFHCLS